MAFYPRFNLETVRIPGVLPRIALCYFAAFLIKKYFSRRAVAGIAAACCLGYWFLMTLVPVPGGLPPNLEPATNLGAWLDRLVFGNHLWVSSKTWDPEGLLSSLPALGTTLFGYLAGSLFRAGLAASEIIRRLLISGVVMTAAGLAWDTVFPINKSLWTSSYVLFTAGLASLFLAGFYWVADVKGYRSGLRPFVIYGVNAIVVFVASGLLAKTMALIKLPLDGATVSSQVFSTARCSCPGSLPSTRRSPTRWPTWPSGMQSCGGWTGGGSTSRCDYAHRHRPRRHQDRRRGPERRGFDRLTANASPRPMAIMAAPSRPSSNSSASSTRKPARIPRWASACRASSRPSPAE
jgi:hypothetical protein